jgi:hypothetical protein
MSTGKWKKPTGIEQTTRWQERQLRKASPKDRMLHDFLNAQTPTEKRAVIEAFAPHYFVFGTQLNPNNPYKENDDGQLV